MERDDPLIVTAAFDAQSAAHFQDLRTRHFPPDRNIVPAHLTLFHNLPGSALREVEADLRDICAGQAVIPFTTDGPRFLGRGCALEIAALPLVHLRGSLARRWGTWLTSQDRQGFRPHVTVQNKVTPEAARGLQEALAALPPITGQISGLDLWFYRGGPWERVLRVALGDGVPV